MNLLKINLFATAALRVTFLLVAPALVCAQPGSFGDLGRIPKLGEIRGLTAISDSHLAIWYSNIKKDQVPSYEAFLVIYEMRDREFSEVFRLSSSPEEIWHRLTPLGDSHLTGLTIQISHSITDYDAATVIALVEGKFRVVFRGSASEFLDLNTDGIPEIFESMWPDGDGYPTHTTVHVWNGKTYKRLMKISFRNRFGPSVQSAINKASRRTTW